MSQHRMPDTLSQSAADLRAERRLLGRKEILQDGASFVHLLWHFNLQRVGRISIYGA